MKLARTLNDIRLLQSTPPQNISWNEALAMMLDVLLDVREESFEDLSAMDFDAEALAKWRTLANTLLSVPMEAVTQTMPERSRARLETYRERMEEYSEKANSAQEELRELERAEKELQARIGELEETKTELEAQNKKATQLRREIDILEKDIESIKGVDPEMLRSTKEDLMREKEAKKRLGEEFADYSEQLVSVAEERGKLEADVEKAQAELDGMLQKKLATEELLREKQKELAQAEQNCNVLNADIEKLDASIAEKKAVCDELINEKLSRGVELKKQEREQEQAKQDIDMTDKQIGIAQEKTEELKNLNTERRRQLDSITEQIAELEQQNPDLEKQIMERTADLEKERAKQDAEIQGLSQQLSELNMQISEANDKRGALLSEKHTAEASLETCKKQTEDIEAETAQLKQELERVVNQRLEYNNEKSNLLKKRARYEADVEEYKKFFASDECRKTQKDIDRFKLFIQEYQTAINSLFQKNDTVYAEQLANLGESYKRMKMNLVQELNDLWARYNNLSTNYLKIVLDIEERIRL